MRPPVSDRAPAPQTADWEQAQRRSYDRSWAAVERVLEELPPQLHRQATLARYDLGLRQADRGRFDAIFAGSSRFPLLSVAGWLLDDLGEPDGELRDPIERHLFVASVLLAIRGHLKDAILDPSSFAEEGALALAQHCTERAMRELMLAVPPGSPFWEDHARIGVEDLEAALSQADVDARAAASEEPDAWLRCTWSAPARIIASAVAAVSGRAHIVPMLHAMLDDLAWALQVEADLGTLHHDLLVGRFTYPIAAVARAAGLGLHPTPPPERVLGALVTTRTLPAIVELARERLRSSRSRAKALGLATFVSFIEEVERRLRDRRSSTDPDARPGSDHGRGRGAPLFRIAEPTIPRALAMARAFLSADPRLTESWETHREGMLGADEVASRFPAGLILAWLCEDGLEMSGPVDEFLAFTVANGFRYYDHPWSGVDADTIGVFLRLLPHSARGDRLEPAIDPLLRCLAAQVRREGAIPVWVTDCDPPSDAPEDAIALGEGCGTVAAHLLLGLLASGRAGDAETLERGSSGLLPRIGSVGVAANVNYPPAYSLGVLLRLTLGVAGAPLGPQVEAALPAARRALEADLERVLQRPPRSAQQAALLTLACRDAGRFDRLEAGWLPRILRQQRPDGGWPAEPFAAAPNRGGWVSWYSSSTLTTALCHGALMVHSGAPPGAHARGA